jgi:excinuclease ABC subunit A
MGPEGGERGGQVIAHGTPEQVATVPTSFTGQFLARHYTPKHTLGAPGATGSSSTLGIQNTLTTNNGHSHSGPQPFNIIATPDRPRTARGKFIAPEKKTGVPTASAKPQKPAKKSAPKKRSKSK